MSAKSGCSSPDPRAYAERVRAVTERTVRLTSPQPRLVRLTLEGEFPRTRLQAVWRDGAGNESVLHYDVWDRDDNPPDDAWLDPEEIGFTYGRYLVEGCW